ncbi:RNA-directed DNA polymerase, eukaryota [Tanacetum coccineum]
MGVNNRSYYNSKEDQTQKISKSVFGTNFPDHFMARDLWNVCLAYGNVVDVYIPLKKSKAGKKFAFVCFIRVDNLDRLIGNLCTIWIGRLRLYANTVRFQREPKNNIPPNNSQPRKNVSLGAVSNSFADVLKSGTVNPNIAIEPSPVIVLDDSCIIERDFSCSLMGKIKDINALSNLYIILANEGFEKVKLSYLVGHWVLLEMDSVTSKEKILNHVGVGSWFEVLKPACNSFVCEEQLVWVFIKGLHVKDLSRNTFTKTISSWGELVDIDEFKNCPLSCIREREAWMPEFNNETEDDTSSEEESEGNNDNDLGSHNEHVSETSFVKENDVEFQNIPNPSGNPINSEDPFEIYKLLKRHKDVSRTEGNNPGNTSQPNPPMPVNIEKASSNNGKCNHGMKFQASGSILEVMDELIKDLNERKMLWDFIRHLIYSWDGECVLLGEGDWIVDPSMVKNEFLKHFANRFVTPMMGNENTIKEFVPTYHQDEDHQDEDDQDAQHQGIQDDNPTITKLIHAQYSLDDISKIQTPIVREEDEKLKVKATTKLHKVPTEDKSIMPEKATSNDSPLKEIQHQIVLNIIDHDVVAAVTAFFSIGSFPPGCNSSFIALILKSQEAKMVKDFRPISLIGSMYKIITKILANRLSLVILEHVSDVQSAFVSNRQILDGPFILNELLSWCKHKNTKALIFKTYLEKVFDSVRWDYLDVVLNNFGFDLKWRSWIQGCLNSAMGSILVNGSSTSKFKFSKGLKQGDPLSPFLFIMVMESLHLSFNNVVISGLYTDIHIDDSLSLSYFLLINLHKSKLMGIGIPNDVVASAARSIGCSTLHTPFNYLGVKVGGIMSRLGSWDDVVAKLSSRCSKWKLKTLSIGGRLTLIKYVLSSLPLYYMSSFKVPKGVLSKIESIRRNFSMGIDLLLLVKKKVGNGEATSFWNDVWLGDSPLKQTYPRLYLLELDKHASVAFKLRDNSLTRSFQRSPHSDSLGVFSVKSAREFIDDSLLLKADVPTRWVKSIPIKINIFSWRVSLDKLPTRLNLSLRGLDNPSIICPLCSIAAESTSHLLFSCQLARQLLIKVARWWELEYQDFLSYDDWLFWLNNLRISKRFKDMFEGVKRIENGAKTGIIGFVSIKSAQISRSRQSREKSPSMPIERARENESNGALRFY